MFLNSQIYDFLFIGLTKKCYLCKLINKIFMKNKLYIIRMSLVLAMILLMVSGAKAQAPEDPCLITCDQDLPVCSGTSVKLSVPQYYLYSYRWSPSGATTPTVTVKPMATTTY